jgi:hypothetical protein
MSQVKDIIDSIGHRLPDKNNLYPALNRAVRMIAKRLMYHDASMVRGSLAVTITAASSSGSLPSDYWGLVGKPYISTETRYLEPVPDPRYKLLYSENSKPRYYEIVGTTINLYPGWTAGGTINGDYWARPTKLTSPTDTVPFNEMFDDAIEESLLASYTGQDVSVLENIIYKSVDEIVPYIDKQAAYRPQNQMNLDILTNERGN